MRKLLCIEAAFGNEEHVMVLPGLPWGTGRFLADDAAELRRPDGVIIRCVVWLCPEHINRTVEGMRAGVPAFDRMCCLRGISKSEVLAGSEVWCDDAVVRDALGEEDA